LELLSGEKLKKKENVFLSVRKGKRKKGLFLEDWGILGGKGKKGEDPVIVSTPPSKKKKRKRKGQNPQGLVSVSGKVGSGEKKKKRRGEGTQTGVEHALVNRNEGRLKKKKRGKNLFPFFPLAKGKGGGNKFRGG